MRSVYEAAGGTEGLRRLAEAWHSRVMADEIVGHAFSHGFHPQHTERLAAYWAEALGGPTVYTVVGRARTLSGLGCSSSKESGPTSRHVGPLSLKLPLPRLAA